MFINETGMFNSIKFKRHLEDKKWPMHDLVGQPVRNHWRILGRMVVPWSTKGAVLYHGGQIG